MADLKEIPNRDAVVDKDGIVTRPWNKWLTDLRTAVNRLTAGIFDNGITFPDPQVPSSDPNTLDDYEEGTWTPTIGGTGGESGQTYAQQDGFDVKVGRMVHAACRVQLSALGTITGAVQIKGLRFPSINASGYRATGVVFWVNTTTPYVNIVAFVNENSSAIDLVATAAATTSLATQNLVQANLANNTRLIVSVVYEAAQ